MSKKGVLLPGTSLETFVFHEIFVYDGSEITLVSDGTGDDRLQRRSRGFVVPESFTHGTSEQRARWFLLGLRTGDVTKGDTFSIPYEDL